MKKLLTILSLTTALSLAVPAFAAPPPPPSYHGGNPHHVNAGYHHRHHLPPRPSYYHHSRPGFTIYTGMPYHMHRIGWYDDYYWRPHRISPYINTGIYIRF